MAKSFKRRAPLWTRLCAVFGSVLMVVSGGVLVGGNALISRYTSAVDAGGTLIGDPAAATQKSEIKGPINILLAGIDPRDTKTAPLSDSIIVAHIPASMDQVYLFSIPRDLYVDIPAFEPTGFKGGKSKINAAMSYGSSVGNGEHDVKQGFQLLAKTVTKLTGIKTFDAGAIINFGGFKKIVEAMGGVTMTIDQNVKSEHLQPNGKARPRIPGCDKCAHPYTGAQKTYKKGTYHLEAWEALDYVRQRYTLPNGDYDRQRHQQQFVKAMAKQAMSKDVVSNPTKLLSILDAAGDSLTFDGGGNSVIDWAVALRGVNTDDMTSIKLPGGGLFEQGSNKYLGEQLSGDYEQFFQAVKDDQIAPFLLDHPGFVNVNS
ncbi:LCP family protein required for cell wall assembly [Actinoplanes lutulentus]|uniref:LCP family protein n=1 Tax=Actinoplanes lutulentus TaxID=1287878 RepID=UPI0015EB8762|nr:LCP family protein required for cell wall assembly [Actinoplanes lutulentus]